MIIAPEKYSSIKENEITGRYVPYQKIAEYFKKTSSYHKVLELGFSVQNRSIQGIELGTGKHRILMWSQMHGNESTTTKAVVDLINYLGSKETLAKTILEECTLLIIPMLNPDGADAYTRVNANGVDLNRDAQERTQPESRVLRQVFEVFAPHYCFNLHDQRTMYNVGGTNKPATVSFLSPAYDEARNLSVSRIRSMALIYSMNEELQTMIPGQVGRYDDAFNANCVGDAFQMLEVPTILFEAGHYPGDYTREKTREYIFTALLTALVALTTTEFKEFDPRLYSEIPENNKLFYDVLVKHAHVIDASLGPKDAIGINYKEVLEEGAIRFQPEIVAKGNLATNFGHQEYDCHSSESMKQLKNLVLWNILNP